MNRLVHGSWCIACLLLLACVDTQLPAEPTLEAVPTVEQRYVGLADGLHALEALVVYENPSLVWGFEAGGSRALLDAVAAGELDAALVHHVPLSAEMLWHNPVALDGVALIVHPNNPVTALTTGEIQAVFSGDITNWSAVGGADAPIDLLLLGSGSGVRELFAARIMGSRRVSVNSEIRPNISSLQSTVASNPYAIGISTISSLSADVRALAINGIMADNAQVASQTYPLTTPVYWVSLAAPVGELRGLLAYMQSADGQAALGEQFGRIR